MRQKKPGYKKGRQWSKDWVTLPLCTKDPAALPSVNDNNNEHLKCGGIHQKGAHDERDWFCWGGKGRNLKKNHPVLLSQFVAPHGINVCPIRISRFQVNVINSAVVGMFFPYRHVGIIWPRRRHACRHNSSFKIEWNTRRKTVKTKVSRVIHAYIISLP